MDIESKQSISISILGKESDKAAAEVIKILASGTAKGIVECGGNILGGLLGDRIKEWRTRNFINSASKTAEFLAQKGISLDEANCLSDGEVYRLFDGSSRTDEGLVSEMWAGLLANSMDPNNTTTFDIHFTKVLEQIHSQDVKILDFMRFHFSRTKKMRQNFPKDFNPGFQVVSDIQTKDAYEAKKVIFEQVRMSALKDINEKYDKLNIDPDLIKNSIENLVRLGLIFLEDEGVNITTSHLTDGGFSHDGQIDNRKLVSILDDIVLHLEHTTNHKLREQEGSLFVNEKSSDGRLRLMYDFTGFGERFLSACYID